MSEIVERAREPSVLFPGDKWRTARQTRARQNEGAQDRQCQQGTQLYRGQGRPTSWNRSRRFVSQSLFFIPVYELFTVIE